MRIEASTKLLVAGVAAAMALETEAAGLVERSQTRFTQFPDKVLKRCDECCPITIRTIMTTILSTL